MNVAVLDDVVRIIVTGLWLGYYIGFCGCCFCVYHTISVICSGFFFPDEIFSDIFELTFLKLCLTMYLAATEAAFSEFILSAPRRK